MKYLLTSVVLLTLAGPVVAFDLGIQAGDKPVVNYPENVPAGRQGGDTILDATPIDLPYSGTGTTAGYVDDYDEVCPYSQSTSPDVVYTTMPAATVHVDIDLLGSTYDTKLYVYDENFALVACNDDFYSDFVSKLENLSLMGGVRYYIVIDGYGGDFGDYVLNITEVEPCVLICPPSAVHENEPPLAIDYEDTWNGGCNTDHANPPLQMLTQGGWFCGVSGFYINQGVNTRDTDWFSFFMPDQGYIEFTGDAEIATYMFELGPPDCDSVGVLQNVTIGPCSEGTLVITGEPGATTWFWVGPTTFSSPDGSDVYEYDYVICVFGCGIATESHSWSDVKSLFR